MSNAFASGVVSISIDAETGSQSSTSLDAVDSVVVELFDRLQKQRTPATWMFDDPQRHALVDRIIRSGKHELALGGGRQEKASSGTIGQLLECQRAGLPITTVSENTAWQPRDFELLAKHGITVIRSARAISGARGFRPVRYGVWNVPVSAELNGGSWVPYFAQIQRMRRTIDQAMRQAGVCHLCIDAASISRSDTASGLRAVERLLAQLSELQLAGSAAVLTLRDTATRLQPKRTAPAATSILRAA